jgi:hypothetical protein
MSQSRARSDCAARLEAARSNQRSPILCGDPLRSRLASGERLSSRQDWRKKCHS